LFIYRLYAGWLYKRGRVLHKSTIDAFELHIQEIMEKKGSCTITVIGSPGTGKSTAARVVRAGGLFSIPKEKIVVVDDLFGEKGERYRVKDLKSMSGTLTGKLLILFDYRAARYLKNADIGLILMVGESERLSNLGKRSPRSLKRYRKKFYRMPPIPFTYKPLNTYVCGEDIVEMLKNYAQV
jgi:hypothetical protein